MCLVPACYICLDSGVAPRHLHRTGCACRGTSGYVHVDCSAESARRNPVRWSSCPTCRQDFTGVFSVSLAAARVEDTTSMGPSDPMRLMAEMDYAQSMYANNQIEAALALMKATYDTVLANYEEKDPIVCSATSRMSTLYCASGRPDLALPMDTWVLTNNLVDGQLSESSVTAGNNLAGTMMQLAAAYGRTVGPEDVVASAKKEQADFNRLALLLWQRTLSYNEEQEYSPATEDYLIKGNVGNLHSDMGNHDLALPLLESALSICRRRFGDSHVETYYTKRDLAAALFCATGHHARAKGLMEAAVAGLTAAFGSDCEIVVMCTELQSRHVQ